MTPHPPPSRVPPRASQPFLPPQPFRALFVPRSPPPPPPPRVPPHDGRGVRCPKWPSTPFFSHPTRDVWRASRARQNEHFQPQLRRRVEPPLRHRRRFRVRVGFGKSHQEMFRRTDCFFPTRVFRRRAPRAPRRAVSPPRHHRPLHSRPPLRVQAPSPPRYPPPMF